MTWRRPLTPSERWYWIADQFSSISGGVHLKLRGREGASISEQDVRFALDLIQAEYPLLNTGITLSGKGPEFTGPLGVRIPLRWETRRLDEITDKILEKQFETEMASSFHDPEMPLMRALVWELPTANQGPNTVHAFLSFSHVVCDGRCVVFLTRRFLELLSSRLEEAPTPPAREARMFVIRDGGIENHLPRKYRSLGGIFPIAVYLLTDILRATLARPFRFKSPRRVPSRERRTRIIRRRINRMVLEKLRLHYQKEGASLHGALYAATLLGLWDSFVQPSSPLAFRVGNPTDIRAALSPELQSDLGAFVSNAVTYTRVGGGESFWDLARSFVQQMRQARERGDLWAVIASLRWLAPRNVANAEGFVKMVDKNGPGHVTMSTIGEFQVGISNQHLELLDHDFFGSLSVTGALLTVASIASGELHWNFLYVDGLVDRDTLLKAVDRAIFHLEQAVSMPQIS